MRNPLSSREVRDCGVTGGKGDLNCGVVGEEGRGPERFNHKDVPDGPDGWLGQAGWEMKGFGGLGWGGN